VPIYQVEFDKEAELSENQQRYVLLKASGLSLDEISTKLGLARKTLLNYSTQPKIKRAIQDILDQTFEQTVAILTKESVAAAKKLSALVEGEVPKALEFPASKTLLDLVFRARSNADYERRLLQLEAALTARNEGSRFTPASDGGEFNELLLRAKEEVGERLIALC